ncbi:MAG: hypothetical protein K2N93_01555 [Alistipes sp.]|nr:hypothetical protein [Alistipes sp.]
MMKTKMFFLFVLAVCGIATAAAQEKDRGIFLELNAGYSRNTYGCHAVAGPSYTIDYEFDAERAGGGFALLAPAVGYRFDERWEVGVRAQFELESYYANYTAVGAFARYGFFNRRKWSLFVEGQVSCYIQGEHFLPVPASMIPEGGQVRLNADFDDRYAEAGFTFGASYALTRRLRAQVRYLYLGYSGAPAFHRSGGCWGDGEFVLDAGWNRLQVGLQYTF